MNIQRGPSYVKRTGVVFVSLFVLLVHILRRGRIECSDLGPPTTLGAILYKSFGNVREVLAQSCCLRQIRLMNMNVQR
jgi:hypothetical protein